MICSSGIGLDPVVNEKRLRFGFHGIWQGVALLYDRDTQSQWLHLTGECVRGERKGKMLAKFSGVHTSWKAWREAHPDTMVMGSDPKFFRQYFTEDSSRRGGDFFPFEFPKTIQTRDARLPLTELLYGVSVGDDALAFPLKRIDESGQTVVHEKVGGMPIVVVFDVSAKSATAFDASLDGKALRLTATQEGNLRSSDGDAIFDRSGACISGQWKGKQLQRIGMQAEWYGWRAAYPQSRIWAPKTP